MMHGFGQPPPPSGTPPSAPPSGLPAGLPTPIPGATDPASCTQQGGTWQGLPPPAPPGIGVCLSGALPPIPGVPSGPGGLPAPPPGVQKPEIPGYVTVEQVFRNRDQCVAEKSAVHKAGLRTAGMWGVGALLAGGVVGLLVGKNMKK